ncbi:hypothetical protein [Salinibacterium sp. ZJ450]|uniref:hypothetical protein n=1 Tax=Salinibacterium sp. ZJ450 TaxID=2708338 RepID=UPI0014212FCC|nr:hypothetical protein [Salinibacterium sp. ZJ450]
MSLGVVVVYGVIDGDRGELLHPHVFTPEYWGEVYDFFTEACEAERPTMHRFIACLINTELHRQVEVMIRQGHFRIKVDDRRGRFRAAPLDNRVRWTAETTMYLARSWLDPAPQAVQATLLPFGPPKGVPGRKHLD